ncbi:MULTISPECIES: hypothetical protein [Acinetobacter]|uniref:Uncharacterized protein n=1 Tax=Acinetobacter piscicola TaxID=2006115 RepID=A0A7S7AIJ1_9GAMM|nr:MULTISPECIES: hypothetical protein [Acinetobacter]MDM1757356.1 hypothetical protein [Acinetobacter sp. 256-1]MDM1760348.1 hypothetical protein [Acinetobacter sp. 251-1]QOW46801.1 hypothetical protein G0028_13325 [Acinetobacter piscicola]
MTYKINLAIETSTYQALQNVTERLNQGDKENLSKQLGTIFTDMSCQVLDQVFGRLIEEKRGKNLDAKAQKSLKEAEQIFEQIESALRKYMPWSISFFGNDRLKPVANHILQKFDPSNSEQIYMYYMLDRHLGEQASQNIQQVLDGNLQALPATLKNLIKIIDLGISEFIRDPKTLLKFNFVVDKTLNGVINMITSTGYKRLEKVGDEYKTGDAEKAQHYAKHFNSFLVRV